MKDWQHNNSKVSFSGTHTTKIIINKVVLQSKREVY